MMNIQGFIDRVGIADHAELAARLGTKKSTVDSWSSGARTPTYDMCMKLLELGMTVEELFGKPYLSSVSKAHETLDIKVEDALKRMFAKIGNF
jgi:transcriptional regulator with XRE-family HTH domain